MKWKDNFSNPRLIILCVLAILSLVVSIVASPSPVVSLVIPAKSTNGISQWNSTQISIQKGQVLQITDITDGWHIMGEQAAQSVGDKKLSDKFTYDGLNQELDEKMIHWFKQDQPPGKGILAPGINYGALVCRIGDTLFTNPDKDDVFKVDSDSFEHTANATGTLFCAMNDFKDNDDNNFGALKFKFFYLGRDARKILKIFKEFKAVFSPSSTLADNN